MDWKDIEKAAKSKSAKGVYFLHGKEPYFIDRIVQAFEKEFLDESQKGFDQSIFYGKDSEARQITDAATRYPLMAPAQLVILKEAQQMRNLDALVDYVKNPSPQTVLVIAHPHKKLRMNTSLGKALKANAQVFESKPLYDNKIPDWINQHIKSEGYSLESPQISALLFEYLGADLGKIVNELEKLFLNLPKGKSISTEDIEKYIGINREYNIFELQKALGTKNFVRTQKIVQNFASNSKKNPLVMVVGGLSNYFSKLLIYKSMAGSPEKDLMAAMGVGHSFFLKDYNASARNFSIKAIEDIILILKEYDLKSKGVEYNLTAFGDEGLLQELCLKIISTPS